MLSHTSDKSFKQQLISKADSMRSVRLMKKGLRAIEEYRGHKKKEAKLFETALETRKRAQYQGVLFKLIKVGAYWQKKEVTSFDDIRIKTAFCKWLHLSKPTKAPSPASSRTQTSFVSV